MLFWEKSLFMFFFLGMLTYIYWHSCCGFICPEAWGQSLCYGAVWPDCCGAGGFLRDGPAPALGLSVIAVLLLLYIAMLLLLCHCYAAGFPLVLSVIACYQFPLSCQLFLLNTMGIFKTGYKMPWLFKLRIRYYRLLDAAGELCPCDPRLLSNCLVIF